MQEHNLKFQKNVIDRILEAKRRAGVQVTAATGEKLFDPAQYRRLLVAIGIVALVIIATVVTWRMVEQYRRLNEANYVESLLLEKKYAHLVGEDPLATHLWPEWIPLILGDSQQQSRFRTIYLAGVAFRTWGYAGPVSNGRERDLADIKLLARHRPDVFLDHSERIKLFLAHPYRLANGQVIRTVPDWEPLMPAEAGIPTEFEKKYKDHPALIQQRAKELLVSGLYAALLGNELQPFYIWLERADIALEMGNEKYFRKLLSDKAWYQANGWEGPIPEPTMQALADLRLLYAFNRELFLDAYERTTTKVGRVWGADPGKSFLFFFRIGKNKGVFIDVASDWEKYVAKIPDGPLLPPQAPEE